MKLTDKGWKVEATDSLSLQKLRKKTSFPLPNRHGKNLEDYPVTYYFDSSFGDDANDGSNLHPKKTLEEASRLIKGLGSAAILFHRGRTFEGNLLIEGCHACKELPLYIGGYGKGNRPIFKGEESVIHIYESNVCVRGIEVTGPSALRGIHITPNRPGVMENIYIENCYVHDINWHWSKEKDPFAYDPSSLPLEEICPEYEEDGATRGRYFYRYHGGIIAHNEVGPSYFSHIYIRDNIVKNVARTGITIYNKWVDQPGVGYGYNHWNGYDGNLNFETGEGCFMSDHLCCDGNYLECIGGDGLVLSSASNVRVSKNICYFASYLGRKGYWNAGIWVYNVKGCRFENNECGYTYRLNGAEDGQGFDLDNCCEDVYFVNNLAHHNQGGGLLCCNLATSVPNEKEKQQGRWGNNWVYRNLFYHNGDKKEPTRSAMLTIARQTNCAIYRNNLVLLSPEIVNQSIVHTEDESTFCYFNRFERNLFLSEGDNGARFSMKMMKDSSFRNNAFFHVKKKGSKPIELEKMPPVMSFDEDIFAIPSLSKRIQFAFARAKRAFSFMKGGFKS